MKIYSGMSLSEIQDAADELHSTHPGHTNILLLIANLAARMQEHQNLTASQPVSMEQEPVGIPPQQIIDWEIKPVCRAEELLKSSNKGYIKIKGKRLFLIGVKEYKEALALLRSNRDRA